MPRKKRKISLKIPRKFRYKRQEVESLVVNLAKERKSSAAIGEILKKEYGILDVKVITGKTITQIMKENNLYPELPEDMMNMLRKAVRLRAHLERNRADKHSLRGLEILESKIRRIAKYYIRKNILPKNWKYSPEEAKLIVQK